MRLPGRIVVIVLLMTGVVVAGVLVNKSSLQAADTLHRSHQRSLAVQNAQLVEHTQGAAVGELNALAASHRFGSERASPDDRRVLADFVSRSDHFRYGAAVITFDGSIINFSLGPHQNALPAAHDAGFAVMRQELLAGRAAFSTVMGVSGSAVSAVGVPLLADRTPVAALVGYLRVADSGLQAYVESFGSSDTVTTILDSSGQVAFASDPAAIGTTAEPFIAATVKTVTGPSFVEYASGRTDMIAIVVSDMPGGWALVQTQPAASFDGAVHRRGQTLNVALIAMLLIGAVGMSVVGYRSQVQNRQVDRRFQALFEHATDMVAVIDAEGRIAYCSPSAASVLHLAPDLLHRTSLLELIHPEDRPDLQRSLDALRSRRDDVLRRQARVAGPSGETAWCEFTVSNQLGNPAIAGLVINARDVSANRALQEQLTHDADHDALTGLPNRRHLYDALESSLRNDSAAVLFLDLDGFKPVNDDHGHEAGDELLRQVAGRLSHCARDGDVVARIGGDEFVMLLPGTAHRADAVAMSAEVRNAIGQPFRVSGRQVLIGGSIGVHLAARGADPDQALRAADDAMYADKRARRSVAGRS